MSSLLERKRRKKNMEKKNEKNKPAGMFFISLLSQSVLRV